MRWLASILLLLLLALQYRLWVGDGSLADVQALRNEILVQKSELAQLHTRNQTLEAEVLDLRDGLDALEERARSELGMIKQGEIFVQVIEESGEGAPDDPIPAADSGPPAKRSAGTASSRSGDDGLTRNEVTVRTGREP